MNAADVERAIVLGASRRYVWVRCADGSSRMGRASSKALEIVVGDHVQYHRLGDEALIDLVEPRRNLLMRCYAKQTKRIVANVDLLIVVTAVNPLFNTVFLDRIVAAAAEQHIPVLILVNKEDLGVEETSAEIAIYEKLGIPIMYTSAKRATGLDALRARLMNENLGLVALAGISGVGKSTILNALIPNLDRKTSDVSKRTGQGRQTTSQAYAYDYEVTPDRSIFIVDLPGLQNFGIQHLDRETVASGFTEIERIRSGCQYGNCSHTVEPGCAVLSAVEAGEIAVSRYQSYRDLLAEVDAARPY